MRPVGVGSGGELAGVAWRPGKSVGRSSGLLGRPLDRTRVARRLWWCSVHSEFPEEGWLFVYWRSMGSCVVSWFCQGLPEGCWWQGKVERRSWDGRSMGWQVVGGVRGQRSKGEDVGWQVAVAGCWTRSWMRPTLDIAYCSVQHSREVFGVFLWDFGGFRCRLGFGWGFGSARPESEQASEEIHRLVSKWGVYRCPSLREVKGTEAAAQG